VAEESCSACAAAAVKRREGMGIERRRQTRRGGSRQVREARGHRTARCCRRRRMPSMWPRSGASTRERAHVWA
jgi:hypothetical protein